MRGVIKNIINCDNVIIKLPSNMITNGFPAQYPVAENRCNMVYHSKCILSFYFFNKNETSSCYIKYVYVLQYIIFFQIMQIKSIFNVKFFKPSLACLEYDIFSRFIGIFILQIFFKILKAFSWIVI